MFYEIVCTPGAKKGKCKNVDMLKEKPWKKIIQQQSLWTETWTFIQKQKAGWIVK